MGEHSPSWTGNCCLVCCRKELVELPSSRAASHTHLRLSGARAVRRQDSASRFAPLLLHGTGRGKSARFRARVLYGLVTIKRKEEKLGLNLCLNANQSSSSSSLTWGSLGPGGGSVTAESLFTWPPGTTPCCASLRTGMLKEMQANVGHT